MVVNVDPTAPHDGLAIIPAALGLPPTFFARDLLGGERYRWTIGRNYVRLGPGPGAHLQARDACLIGACRVGSHSDERT